MTDAKPRVPHPQPMSDPANDDENETEQDKGNE